MVYIARENKENMMQIKQAFDLLIKPSCQLLVRWLHA
jgi:hypothetical protein